MKTHYPKKCRIRLASLVVGLSLLMLLSNVPLNTTKNAEAAMTTLKVGMLEPIDSLNPFIGINDNAYVFYGLVYDMLISVDEDLMPKPNLAESWSIVQDEYPVGSVWQYNLVHNAQWHDGEPFTAEDVVFTMNYQTGTNWFTFWAYQPYTLMINWTEWVDDYTVRIHFYNPISKNPAAIAFGESLMIPIVPKHIWESIPAGDAAFGYPNPHPIGTGPFMCTNRTEDEFLSGERLILYRNPNYHLGAVKFERLILEFYLEPAAMVTDIQRGALDLAAFATPNYKNLMDWLEENPNENIGSYSGLSCTSYSVEIDICQSTSSPGSTNHLRRDPVVRQAMAYATDKEFIRDHIYMGYADVGYSLFSKIYGDWYWEPAPGEAYEYNITKANQILDDAGYYWAGNVRKCPSLSEYKSYTDELKFDVLVETELFEDKATALFLQEQWAQIGVQLDLIFVDSATWNNIVYNSGGAFDMAMTYWSGDPDPNYLLYTQSTSALSGWSENYYSSAEYDDNYTQSILHTEKSERLPYVHNCLKHIYQDCAFIVNAYPYGCWAWRKDHFEGWGDWGAHPGRQLSNFWSANDLFFELTPILTNEPPLVVLDVAAGFAGEAVTISGYTWDAEGDALSYYIEFGDGTNSSGTTTSATELAFPHTYNLAGEYAVNLTVNDSTSGNIARSVAYIVPAGSNAPPSNVRILPDPMEGLTIPKDCKFRWTARDANGDPLNVKIDFGDGTPIWEANVTDTLQLVNQTVEHTYASTGSFDVNLTVSDGVNSTTHLLTVTVTAKTTGTNWALIGGAIVAVVVVAAVAAVVLRKKRGPRKEKKEEEDVRLP